MSIIEGIGDDLLTVFICLFFLALISLAWLSTYVYLPNTFVDIQQRIVNLNISTSFHSNNDSLTEHESDLTTSDSDEQHSESMHSTGEDEQLLRITIKFLNDTQKSLSVNPNHTISKIKRLYFADELSNNQIIRFIYQGRELENGELLRRYNIRDQTIIHCQITSRRRHSTPIRLGNQISSSSSSHPQSDTSSSFVDLSPIRLSIHFLVLSIVFLGSLWCLRIYYRVLFTPISTIILILITVLFLIFTCGPFLFQREQYSIN